MTQNAGDFFWQGGTFYDTCYTQTNQLMPVNPWQDMAFWINSVSDCARMVSLAKMLAERLGIAGHEQNKDEPDFSYVLRILGEAHKCVLLATPRKQPEPLARETKVKFDNRCAGSRWR